MHNMETVNADSGATSEPPRIAGLDFLWLELTNRCNLQCVHCYTDSHPHSGQRDVLTTEQYESVMRQAYELGCRKIQFIGGEPQLNRDFKSLLRTAREIGYDFIEVFSNLTLLDDETLQYSARQRICFATSVYSDDPAVHDGITNSRSSHARTIGNLRRLIAGGIVTRAGIIVIHQDPHAVERTKQFLLDLGVGSVRVSEVKEFGRGEAILAHPARMSGLCGHCWQGKLAVAPDGFVYPCVMARQWSVGNLLQDPLSEIVHGMALRATRREIYDSVWLPRVEHSDATACNPPCHPSCSQGCTPDACPETPCLPQICPQSCIPDEVCSPTLLR